MTHNLIFAEEPYTLHLLAGSNSITALDAIKALLDAGLHNVNELEPDDNLSPLHVAAHWDNVAICQLLIHYGANTEAVDIDGRRPVDISAQKCRKILKRTRRRGQGRFKKFLALLFRHACIRTSTADDSILVNKSALSEMNRSSCPNLSHPQVTNREPSRLRISGLNFEDLPISQNFNNNIPHDSILGSQFFIDPTENILDNGPSFLNLPKSIDKQTIKMQSKYMRNEIIPTVPVEIPVDDEVEQLQDTFASMSLGSLRKRLRQKNLDVGPIDTRNRRLYEAKLARFEVGVASPFGESSAPKYSPALLTVIKNSEIGISPERIGIAEEALINAEYSGSIPNQELSFFCYLLIDPSLLHSTDLPPTLQDFVSAIFYVGKGKGARPLQHMINAYHSRDSNIDKNARSKKLQRICDLWDLKLGVISLNIFTNVHSEEAFVREGAMIDAIGLTNLTNLKRGQFHGVARRWTNRQITEFGSLLLKRAHTIFQNERCRPLLDTDIEVTANNGFWFKNQKSPNKTPKK